MKKIIYLLFFFPAVAFAQFTDNFSDGDFTANPAWSGDAAKWQVTAGQLESNSAVLNDTFYLSTASTIASNAQWELYVKLDFSTSGNNWVDIYLTSTNADLKASLNGYFVRMGNTSDDICLYRRDGNTVSIIIDGVNGRSQTTSSNNLFKIKVTRSAANSWTLADDVTGTGTSYFTEGSVTDATYSTSAYFGFSIKQSTASFFSKHYFDDIYVGSIVLDVTPPTINSATVISSTQLDVKFSEPVDLTTSQTAANYSVDNGIGNPSSAVRDVSDLSLVHLTFATAFTDGLTNTVTINGVQDLSANTIAASSTKTFVYSVPATPQPFDVVINEVLFDPDPQITLPLYEYVEIYNRSTKTFDLTGWQLGDASSFHPLTSYTLLPNHYLILCSTTAAAAFASYGEMLAVSSFPSLNNTGGETVTLLNSTGATIDKMYYDETYYHDSNKNDGGWSIERINPDFTCLNEFNWTASNDTRGGSPGSVNSVKGSFSDNVSPQLLRACLVDSVHVQLFFDEPVSDTALTNLSNFSITKGSSTLGNPVVSVSSSDFTSVVLELPAPVTSGIYTMAVTSTVSDCAGNQLGNISTANFAFSETLAAGDVIINEVLFNARDGGAEFVELYNKSSKIIDLDELKISRIKLGTDSIIYLTDVTAGCYLIFPGDYVAMTDNPTLVKNQYTIENPKAFLQTNLPDLLTDEDIVVIYNNVLDEVDKLHYNSSWHFPLLNSVDGVSLERLSASRATQDSTNWHSAAQTAGFATPGYKNSEYSDGQGDGSEVSIEPEIFSPDEDGKSDNVNIHFHFATPGYTATIQVYDAKGRLVRNLISNQLIGNDGIYSWDGVSDEKTKARIGIYIFYMEVFDVSGNLKKYKRTCVLASKL